MQDRTHILCQYELYPHIHCSMPLTPKAVEYCKKNKEKFNNKLLCFNHQQRILKEKEQNGK